MLYDITNIKELPNNLNLNPLKDSNQASLEKPFDNSISNNSKNVKENLNNTINGEIRASIEFTAEGKAVIRVFPGSNVADVVHETGHLFRYFKKIF